MNKPENDDLFLLLVDDAGGDWIPAPLHEPSAQHGLHLGWASAEMWGNAFAQKAVGHLGGAVVRGQHEKVSRTAVRW